MKHTILTMTLAAQLAAGTALAQTTDAQAPAENMETGMTSGSFGNDWPTTLSLALLEQDGTTVRPETEIATQWETLSDADQEIIRRDCELLMEQSDTMNGDGTDIDTAVDDMADTSTPAIDSGDVGIEAETDPALDTETEMSVDPAATTPLESEPAISGDTGVGTTEDMGAAGTDGMMIDETPPTVIALSEEQMEEICIATSDL
ncbi:hypothetical protein [Yoonia sp.]|uniref:hypothetical protein n=1 Tax=Yoonia sp. TaxID=2212373 RepID=UPI00391C968A